MPLSRPACARRGPTEINENVPFARPPWHVTVGLPDMSARRAQLVRRKTRLALLIALASVLVLTACGSRRPMKDFVAAGSTAKGGTQLGQTTPDSGTQLPGGGISSAPPGAVLPGTSNGGSVGPSSSSSNGGTTQGS